MAFSFDDNNNQENRRQSGGRFGESVKKNKLVVVFNGAILIAFIIYLLWQILDEFWL